MLETAIDPPPLVERKRNSTLELLWTGNVIDRKALIIAIDALGEFAKSRPHDCVHLTVVGDGPMRAQAEARAAELGIEDMIEFLGRVPFERVLDLTEQCDAFLFTSVQDTSGNVVLEAMSRGKPVITIDHQGAAEIVTEQSGVKIPVGPYESVVSAFAKSLDEYVDDPEAARRAGITAYETILARHSWKSRMQRYDDVLRQILR